MVMNHSNHALVGSALVPAQTALIITVAASR
jgi:hypothetical protein